jgi:ubiquinone/menaquinone biosynthesis C-methylase UbiE
MRTISRSTQRKYAAVKDSSRALFIHVAKQLLHNGKLSSYCRGKSELLLNIGCGRLIRDGWINIDYREGTAFYLDVLDGLPIADSSVRHIHCEHFLEHLEYGDARSFLAECHRVLGLAGTMRVIVPDAEKYMQAYCADDAEFFAKLIDLGGHVEPLRPKMRVCNHSFRMWGAHRFAWDFECLQSVIADVGFSRIRRSALNDVDARFAIDGQDWWRPYESLYANLTK